MAQIVGAVGDGGIGLVLEEQRRPLIVARLILVVRRRLRVHLVMSVVVGLRLMMAVMFGSMPVMRRLRDVMTVVVRRLACVLMMRGMVRVLVDPLVLHVRLDVSVRGRPVVVVPQLRMQRDV